MRIRARLLLAPVCLLIAALAFSQVYCPRCGIPLTPQHWVTAPLKNRTELPQRSNFDGRVTLDALLQPGDDRGRWSESRAAAVTGYVVEVKEAGVELVNCLSPLRRDTHIALALRPDAPPREQLIIEVTPRLREWAQRQGWDWSSPGLQRELTGHKVRVEGWLFFDRGHADEAENTSPGGARNWRASAWEIHPVTRLEVLR
jgi:hypothetical protein